ncbi:mitochondrial fission regulator 1-like [Lutra lutra]|uniref:mitochondrial fission regulator 1-like n=1 Tax=Lutra lutra TaxID=9657 RepID=UPI001FD21C5E|nr:mitochondrial fission regulator 1-like [Lutra lutra]
MTPPSMSDHCPQIPGQARGKQGSQMSVERLASKDGATKWFTVMTSPSPHAECLEPERSPPPPPPPPPPAPTLTQGSRSLWPGTGSPLSGCGNRVHICLHA